MVVTNDDWEVVGGVGKGGLIVRTQKSTSSTALPERLSTGALIAALEHDEVAGRLRYELLTGVGPCTGWVATHVQGRALLMKAVKSDAGATAARPGTERQIPSGAQEQVCLKKHKEVLLWYSKNFVQDRHSPEVASISVLHDTPAGSHKLDAPIAVTFWDAEVSGDVSGVNGHGDRAHYTTRDGHWDARHRNQFNSAADQCSRRNKEPHKTSRRLLVKVVDTRKPVRSAVSGMDLLKEALIPPEALDACQWPSQHGEEAAKHLLSLLRGPAVILSPPSRPALPAHTRMARLHGPAVMLGYDGVSQTLAPTEKFSIKRGQENVHADDMIQLCSRCHLPLGEVRYACAQDGHSMHGECKAQAILEYIRSEEEARQQRDASSKRSRRAEYGIGWQADCIPRNIALSTKFGCTLRTSEMCCVCLHTGSKSVYIAPTHDPAAAVNLEYLLLALQVRRREGREPLFSLDPLDSFDADSVGAGWQVTRFEPPWLAGTSVGEVMFQADYHLKELSMGECTQPVVGMKSSFEYAEAEGPDDEWSAREWFVVKEAEVRLSDGHALIPYVRMGVEAREQIRGEAGLEDAPMTRPDHPAVRYADAFSAYFDLIAERKSVIHQLRELAKASVLAKFLVEAQIDLDEAWFTTVASSRSTQSLRIPQLWNERRHSQIQMSDGRIKDWDEGIVRRTHGVYGGVQMGLDRFPLQEIVVAPARISRGQLGQRPTGFAPSRAFIQSMASGVPQGVDLNLDRFNLSATVDKVQEQLEGGGGVDPSWPAGKAFWASIDCGRDRAAMMLEVFNPYLSDRREEGDDFMPPDSNSRYLERLCGMLDLEEAVRRRRVQHFLSTSFAVGQAGPLFPSSWTSSVKVEKVDAPHSPSKNTQECPTLHSCPLCAAPRFERQLKSLAPMFDKFTEDGFRFRVYRIGSYEIRTTQGRGALEQIGAVLSSRTPLQAIAALQTASTAPDERVAKVVEYVERASLEVQQHSYPLSNYHYYLVLETLEGSTMITEQGRDSKVTWVGSPADLEMRNASAKVTQSMDCRSKHVTVSQLRACCSGGGGTANASAERGSGKDHSQRVFNMILQL